MDREHNYAANPTYFWECSDGAHLADVYKHSAVKHDRQKRNDVLQHFKQRVPQPTKNYATAGWALSTEPRPPSLKPRTPFCQHRCPQRLWSVAFAPVQRIRFRLRSAQLLRLRRCHIRRSRLTSTVQANCECRISPRLGATAATGTVVARTVIPPGARVLSLWFKRNKKVGFNTSGPLHQFGKKFT